jgi:RNA polymerase sigma-70 factor (ECF subfamily)
MNFQKDSLEKTNNKNDSNLSDEISGDLNNESLYPDPAIWLEQYGEYLYRYAYMQLKNESSAEDAVQEALMSAYKAREQFQGKASLKTWLMTILRNKVIDIIRKQQRDSLILMDSIEDDPIVNEHFGSSGIWSKWLNSWGSNPEKLYEQNDFFKHLRKCLNSLPENLRQVFILKNVDDYSTEEICKDLDINANNVWVILYRARMRLRKCLDKSWFQKSV